MFNVNDLAVFAGLRVVGLNRRELISAIEFYALFIWDYAYDLQIYMI